jgi:two-component system chemotaxis response regulator CheY
VKAIIVDDSRVMRSILKRFLGSEGFQTLIEAGDGEEGLLQLKQTGPVDLALVDWNMPRMNGLEFVRALRSDAALAKVRVMMVTTEAETSQVTLALEAGANEYVMKPFTTEILRGKLELLGLAGASRA